MKSTLGIARDLNSLAKAHGDLPVGVACEDAVREPFLRLDRENGRLLIATDEEVGESVEGLPERNPAFQVEALRKELDQAHARESSLQEEIDGLRSALDTKDEHMRRLTAARNEHGGDVTKLRQQVRALEAQVQELRGQLHRSEQDVAAAKAAAAEPPAPKKTTRKKATRKKTAEPDLDA